MFPLLPNMMRFSLPLGMNAADVFEPVLWTGNGAARSLTPGINMSGHGGLVWIKSRSAADPHLLYDTNRGATISLPINPGGGNAEATQAQGLTAFSSTGFSLGTHVQHNASGDNYVGWTFRQAARFFDVVTYTGNGGTQNIAHNLGIAPGFILVKRRDTGNWIAWHRSANGGAGSAYNLFDQFTSSNELTTGIETRFGNGTAYVAPTSTQFTVGSTLSVSGATYVAYLFAHDTLGEGIIQCGAFDTDAGGLASVSLGWRPQFLMLKDVLNNAEGQFMFYDTSRGWNGTSNAFLETHVNAENPAGTRGGAPTATGFDYSQGGGGEVTTYNYVAIRAAA